MTDYNTKTVSQVFLDYFWHLVNCTGWTRAPINPFSYRLLHNLCIDFSLNCMLQFHLTFKWTGTKSTQYVALNRQLVSKTRPHLAHFSWWKKTTQKNMIFVGTWVCIYIKYALTWLCITVRLRDTPLGTVLCILSCSVCGWQNGCICTCGVCVRARVSMCARTKACIPFLLPFLWASLF